MNDTRIGVSSIAAYFTLIHALGNAITSVRFGLQDATKDANLAGGGIVTVDPAWTNAGVTAAFVQTVRCRWWSKV